MTPQMDNKLTEADRVWGASASKQDVFGTKNVVAVEGVGRKLASWHMHLSGPTREKASPALHVLWPPDNTKHLLIGGTDDSKQTTGTAERSQAFPQTRQRQDGSFVRFDACGRASTARRTADG